MQALESGVVMLASPRPGCVTKGEWFNLRVLWFSPAYRLWIIVIPASQELCGISVRSHTLSA